MTRLRIGNFTVQVAFDAIDVAIIQEKTPVITGNLRDNFTLDPDGDIINPVDYALEIELGTVNSPGAFMVERSLDELGNRLAKRIAEQIDRPGLIVLPEIILKVGK